MKVRQWKRLPLLGAIALLAMYMVIASPRAVLAMHISEGFLPVGWALGWWLGFLPFLGWGLWSLRQQVKTQPESTLLLALAGAYAFVLSSLKLPSVTGSSSHPTGIALGTVLFRPPIMTVLATLVLLFQALLIAHGGLTTLGANGFSMAVVGPWVAWGCYNGILRLTGKPAIALFTAAFAANVITYALTAWQLALAFPDSVGGVAAAFGKFAAVFAITQIPLAISEGLLTVLVWNWLTTYCAAELRTLNLLQERGHHG
ncbi:energy-coupling factor ABC transporter permease [Synechococcus sp. PCC 6717]|jgi:cobalt/nickel transport system permease protein|nr:energy-coupling factor ABC transporter permease [Synechococcus sp. PCC 6717]